LWPSPIEEAMPPFDRPEEQAYIDWCELHPCPECEGTGMCSGDGYDFDSLAGEHACRYCDGSGLDPGAAGDIEE